MDIFAFTSSDREVPGNPTLSRLYQLAYIRFDVTEKRRIEVGRDGIKSPRVIGMAFQHSRDRQKQGDRNGMLPKAITGVTGARGMKPAPAAGTEHEMKKRRDE
jgi:hypothetical protein